MIGDDIEVAARILAPDSARLLARADDWYDRYLALAHPAGAPSTPTEAPDVS